MTFQREGPIEGKDRESHSCSSRGNQKIMSSSEAKWTRWGSSV